MNRISSFNPALALMCVRASSRAYMEATDSEPVTNTQYLIIESPDRVIVAFRGTKEAEDFITDADFYMARINLNFDERVHLGFYRAYQSVENRLKARLDEIIARRPGIQITFTGHSLGGALAILAAFYLQYFYSIEAVITFGAPDVGNREFAARYARLQRAPDSLTLDDKTVCFGNACDPVTWLPPYRFGFRRVGRFFFLPGVTWLKAGFKLSLATRWIAGAHQVLLNWIHGKLALLPNHSLVLYTTRVEALCA